MRARNVVALFGALVLAFVAFAGPAAAQQSYPTQGSSGGEGSVSPRTVEPGGTVTFTGGGFDGGAVLSLAINGRSAGTTTADSSGNFSARLQLTDCGVNTLTATGRGAGGENRVVTARANVRCAAAAATSRGALPRTGSDVTTTALVAGLALVMVGGTLVLGARTRMRRTI
jgi:LPXTG-motif cell wall-anchored protein